MATQTPPRREAYVPTWDPFVRLFHWLLVAGFVVAYVTQEDRLDLHVWSGYAVGGLILLRIVWGFVGPRHARFRDFLYRPRQVFGYLRGLIRVHARRYLGHSPAGGVMIFGLLLFLILTVATGLMLYGQENHAGPLAPLYGGIAAANAPAAVMRAEHGNGKTAEAEGGESLEELHELFANVTLALVIVHVLGVLATSLVHRENLALSMITGRKRAPDNDDVP